MEDPSMTLAARDHDTARPSAWDARAIFQRTRLSFDPGDKRNASLYLCDPSNAAQSAMIDAVIARLRGHALWSQDAPKQVRDDQRQAYQEQLVLVESVALTVDGAPLVLARCEHPKFPSSAERFSAWKTALGLG